MDRLASMAVFAKVAELGSFSAAADTLCLSKSAVSKHVTALEERLGVRLVNRTTRRLALTEVGLSYRETCARIVQEVEEAEQEAGTPLHPADLDGHNCLRYTYRRGPEAWELERDGERHVVRLRGNLAANNGDALRAAAIGGLGIVVLPDFIVADDLASGRLVHLLADWRTPEFPIQAVWPPQRHPSPKLRAFVDFLADRLARRCPGPAQRDGAEAAL
jgi:DNA-binding transcriptional LysR family regulator